MYYISTICEPLRFAWVKASGALCMVMVMLVISSCDSFVDVPLPDSQLSSPLVFEDKATANAAIADIYASMRKSGMLSGNASGLSNLLGNYTDELAYYGSGAQGTGIFYNNALVATNADVATLWNISYNQVYSANAILEGLEGSESLQESDKLQLKGEALFIRALLHFYLSGLYGDVPYITSTDYRLNSQVPRTSAAALYDAIVNDLTAAIELLPENYPTAERARANKYCGFALLARVYLYNGQWAEAADAASAVLNNPSYALESELSQVFLRESTETIWHFAPDAAGSNADEGATFIFAQGPPPFVALAEGFISSFESGDGRKDEWTRAVSDGSTTWNHPYKYRQNSITGTSMEYSVLLRLGEQYLIRAEARAMQGNLIGAQDDLNVIRNRAGLGNTAAISQQELITAIAAERRSELFTEIGHRFFDLKRTGLLDSVLSVTKPGWNAADRLFPIPQAEIGLNENLAPQNPGY